ncbi:MAG TPA: prephenate dehydratase domain-containing protein [Candidatus Dormibacteraeota bacterium]|nr:prephenate dehydratase domain-containing protein [Candidatus Dormibacteraeota bacterium]
MVRRRSTLLDTTGGVSTRARLRVGYQGEPGAYSEEALLTLYPDADPIGQRSFAMAFEALLSGEVDLDVLPVENTLGGIVQEVNDLLWERPGLRLIGEHVHPIQHCLLGISGAPIRRAISHPQALAQTRRYLEARGIEPIPYHDTAGAARYLAERPEPGLAAVASAAAARRYGLEILATGIQDDDANQTRFVIVQRGAPERPAGATPGSKCSLCFVAAHVPGSLVAALQCFSARGVNLTRLESRPIPGKPFEYRFFLDFQVADPEAAEAALCELEATTHEVRLFGTYRSLCPPAGR